MIITSQHNEKLKEVRKLHVKRERNRAGRFVAEGEDLLAAADAAGWTAVERFCAAGTGLPGTEVDPAVLSTVTELASGARALGVYEIRYAPAPVGPLCVYLHGVADPGNVGTVLRGAEAFGASSVAIGPETADPFSTKAVRASMGAIFGIPVCRTDIPTARGVLPGTTIALDATPDALPLAQLVATLDPGSDVTLLVGAERTGLPEEVLQAADHVARIPIATHSLNAAMAATVGLYELRRMARG